MKKSVTEDMHPEKEWFAKARECANMNDLKKLYKELFEDTIHDYGTMCHAVGAFAIAAARIGSYNMGLTGFQAGFVMWDFIKEYMCMDSKIGLRLTDYEDMLYPQYEHKFNTINTNNWNAMQKEAKKLLKSNVGSEEVRAHWQSIVDGNVPFGYKVTDDIF